jgi:hypothetical protein
VFWRAAIESRSRLVDGQKSFCVIDLQFDVNRSKSTMLNAVGVGYGAVDYIIKHLGSLTLNQLIQLERINPKPDMPKDEAGLGLDF